MFHMFIMSLLHWLLCHSSFCISYFFFVFKFVHLFYQITACYLFCSEDVLYLLCLFSCCLFQLNVVTTWDGLPYLQNFHLNISLKYTKLSWLKTTSLSKDYFKMRYSSKQFHVIVCFRPDMFWNSAKVFHCFLRTRETMWQRTFFPIF